MADSIANLAAEIDAFEQRDPTPEERSTLLKRLQAWPRELIDAKPRLTPDSARALMLLYLRIVRIYRTLIMCVLPCSLAR